MRHKFLDKLLSMATRNVASRDQLNLMVTFLESHPEMYRNKITESFTAVEKKKLWRELTLRLNADGSCQKTQDKWIRTWTDLKCGVKRKLMDKKTSSSALQETPPSKMLSDLEERVAAMIIDAAESDTANMVDFDNDSAHSTDPEMPLERIKEEPIDSTPSPVTPPVLAPIPLSGKRKREYEIEDFIEQQKLLIKSNELLIASNDRLAASHDRLAASHERAASSHERAAASYDRAAASHDRATASQDRAASSYDRTAKAMEELSVTMKTMITSSNNIQSLLVTILNKLSSEK